MLNAARSPRTARPMLGQLVCAALALAGGAAAAQDGLAAQGLRLMTERTGGNCIACHALPGQAGVQSSFGPALNQVGARYSAAELRQWVSDARLIKPDTLMPPFGSTQGLNQPNPAQAILTPEQITQVVAALQTLR
jgi:sulfur-oxidizing protein SoxX